LDSGYALTDILPLNFMLLFIHKNDCSKFSSSGDFPPPPLSGEFQSWSHFILTWTRILQKIYKLVAPKEKKATKDLVVDSEITKSFPCHTQTSSAANWRNNANYKPIFEALHFTCAM
jgi:hypothetical protein